MAAKPRLRVHEGTDRAKRDWKAVQLPLCKNKYTNHGGGNGVRGFTPNAVVRGLFQAWLQQRQL
jgi:hypothetical protein